MTGRKTPDRREASDPTRQVVVDLASPGRDRSYTVHVGSGLLRDAGRLISDACPAHRYAVITDDVVGPLHGDRLVAGLRAAGLDSILLSVPAGESSKTRAVWGRLCDELIGAGVGRDGAVVALGGGVVGDLAGFVAATYMRGVPFVQVPTTLLAMLDSSVGGKTGLDTADGKNLVGAFHQPALVLIDTDTLRTLPERQMTAGLAEAYKHGLILDADYFEWLDVGVEAVFERRSGTLASAIGRSVELKARVVAEDERELGYRAILNFGHTVGHAIEAAAGYSVAHGEAVALGMVAEAAVGEALGVTRPGVAKRIRLALARARLAVDAAGAVAGGLDRGRFAAALGIDKKRTGGEVRVVLLRRIGEVAAVAGGGWTQRVPADVLSEAVFGESGGV